MIKQPSLPVRQWSVLEPPKKPKNCILGLAGRNNNSETMLEVCADLGLHDTLVVGVRPTGFAWYPQPKSPFDQERAVAGLKSAKKQVERVVNRITSAWGIPSSEIVLLGFSAGAVMSVYTATHSSKPFKAVVSFAGALLEPDKLPQCKHPDMPIILQHNMDDLCFAWDERYLPMRESLKRQKHKIYTIEHPKGGHTINYRDILPVSNFLGPLLGYKNWQYNVEKLKATWQEREIEAQLGNLI